VKIEVDDGVLALDAAQLVVRYQCWGNYHIPQDCDLHHQSSTPQNTVCMCVTQHVAPEDTLYALLCASSILVFILIWPPNKKLQKTNYNNLNTESSGKYVAAKRTK